MAKTTPMPLTPASPPPQDGPPLKVGMMVHGFPVLSETFVSTLAADLVAAGHDLRVLVADPGAPVAEDPPALAGRIARARTVGRPEVWHTLCRMGAAPGRAPVLAGLLALDRLVPGRLAVTRMLMAEDPFDVVHAQFGPLGLTAARHRRWGTLRTRALVVHLRGYDITRFVRERGRGVYSRLFGEADLFIAVCRHFRDLAIDLGCPPDKIRVIGSPIDTGVFAPPKLPRRSEGAVRLVAVGRLVEKKGFADAIEAAAILTGQGRDICLDILGEGPLRGDLEGRITRAGLAGRVRLHGAASGAQVLAALHGADIALAPSVTAADGDTDGIANTAKEAMATGLPVIATRHGGLPELVIPGENGDLVAEHDPGALARAIARMMGDPAARGAMGEAGRQRVVAAFDRGHVLRETVKAYRMALGQAGARPEPAPPIPDARQSTS